MIIERVELSEMMAEREARAFLQAEMLKEYGLPLVSLSMNIAGDVKNTPAIEFMFAEGLGRFEAEADRPPVKKIVRCGKCGPHALLCYDLPAQFLKDTALRVEERLFDFDVIGTDGIKLSRPEVRRCIVCGGPVTVCSRSRAHGLEAIKEVTDGLIIDFMSTITAKMAVEALKEEARLTPKPGLVDSANNGAHKDMDLGMFLDSAEVLSEHFRRFFVIGARNDDCIDELIAEGIKAEQTMLETTGGVNTHKGAVFSFSLALAAFGAYAMRGGDLKERIIRLARDKELRGVSEGTHMGGRALKEAVKGYPLAFKAAEILAVSDAYRALCSIMAELTDSNLLYRGGEEALAFVQSEAAGLLKQPEGLIEGLAQLDRVLIERNLSPGGAADTLALALLLKKLYAYASDLSQEAEYEIFKQ